MTPTITAKEATMPNPAYGCRSRPSSEPDIDTRPLAMIATTPATT